MAELFDLLISLAFYGTAYGMILYLLAVGLSVTLGLMRFINLAHGVFAMAGGYLTITAMTRLGLPFLLSVLVGMVIVGAAGMLLERVLFRRFYGAALLDHVLLSIAIIFISVAVARYLYGPLAQPIELPDWLSGRVDIGIGVFPAYRVFLLVVGLLLAVAIWFGIERSRFGASVRAAVDNRHMAESVGINVNRVFIICFGLGTGLAIVVAVAGMGNIGGAFAVALAFGIVDTVIRYFVPELGRILIFMLVMTVLFFKPHGFAPKLQP
jgi:branched-chain amino acid transport system permease protein